MDGIRRLIILGCSGSIGVSALEVAASFPDRIKIVGLSAHKDFKALLRAKERFSVDRLCLSSDAPEGKNFPLHGRDGLRALVRETEADMVLNAISGYAGLASSLDCLETAKDLALANKETMVCAGPLTRARAISSGKRILPVDSEHSAVFFLLQALGQSGIDEVVLTASGGPFWEKKAEEFPFLSVADALKHPTWSMGRKITIDSASMANKGLEVIEAHELFGIDYDRIKVIIHRESRVHSLLRTRDGSLYAQISKPDMRLPIQNALLWPDPAPSPFGRLELAGETLSFHAPDTARFPLLSLAYAAGRLGGSATLAYNAANEVAVDAFIQGSIRFCDMPSVVSAVLDQDWGKAASCLAEAQETDRAVRLSAQAIISGRSKA